jgi:hypothetical protein
MELKMLDLLLEVRVAKESFKMLFELRNFFLDLGIDCIDGELNFLIKFYRKVFYLFPKPDYFPLKLLLPLFLAIEQVLQSLFQKIYFLFVGFFF